MLRIDNSMLCKRVTFVRTFTNGRTHKDSVAFNPLISGKSYENLHSSCNLIHTVSHLQIRLEQLSEASLIRIYYIAGYGIQPAGSSIPVTFVPTGGGKMYGDLQLPNLSADSVSVGDLKITKQNNALLSYNNRCIQPITLGIVEQEYAQPGQMVFYRNKQIPVWRKEGEYNADLPYALYVDALGNAYDTKYVGNTNDRPNNPKQGFQYFDTTLNKPIWWTGSKWVDSTGATV
jgi:hypothetical protein